MRHPTKRGELSEALAQVTTIEELLQLACHKAKELNRAERILVLGEQMLISMVVAGLANQGLTNFDLKPYEDFARTHLLLNEEQIFEQFFKPFCKKVPIRDVWFTPHWSEAHLVPEKRAFLNSLDCRLHEYRVGSRK